MRSNKIQNNFFFEISHNSLNFVVTVYDLIFLYLMKHTFHSIPDKGISEGGKQKSLMNSLSPSATSGSAEVSVFVEPEVVFSSCALMFVSGRTHCNQT